MGVTVSEKLKPPSSKLQASHWSDSAEGHKSLLLTPPGQNPSSSSRILNLFFPLSLLRGVPFFTSVASTLRFYATNGEFSCRLPLRRESVWNPFITNQAYEKFGESASHTWQTRPTFFFGGVERRDLVLPATAWREFHACRFGIRKAGRLRLGGSLGLSSCFSFLWEGHYEACG